MDTSTLFWFPLQPSHAFANQTMRRFHTCTFPLEIATPLAQTITVARYCLHRPPRRYTGLVNRHSSSDIVWCAHARRRSLVGPMVVVVVVALRGNGNGPWEVLFVA